MICETCGREVKRVCRECQRERARAGLLLHQRPFLRTWLAGTIELRVREYNGATHIELFDDRWHSYCYLDMFEHPERRRRVRELPAELCVQCRKIFDELVAKASQEAT